MGVMGGALVGTGGEEVILARFDAPALSTSSG